MSDGHCGLLKRAAGHPSHRPPFLPLFTPHHQRTLPRAGGGLRRRILADPTTGTIFLNTAVVPRVGRSADGSATLHHTTLVELAGGAVRSVRDVWLLRGGEGAAAAEGGLVVARQQQLLESDGSGARRLWDAHEQKWLEPEAAWVAAHSGVLA